LTLGAVADPSVNPGFSGDCLSATRAQVPRLVQAPTPALSAYHPGRGWLLPPYGSAQKGPGMAPERTGKGARHGCRCTGDSPDAVPALSGRGPGRARVDAGSRSAKRSRARIKGLDPATFGLVKIAALIAGLDAQPAYYHVGQAGGDKRIDERHTRGRGAGRHTRPSHSGSGGRGRRLSRGRARKNHGRAGAFIAPKDGAPK